MHNEQKTKHEAAQDAAIHKGQTDFKKHDVAHDHAQPNVDALTARVFKIEEAEKVEASDNLKARVEKLETAPATKGDKGDAGVAGKDGVDGKNGLPGEIGRDGAEGKVGERGEKGEKGEKGDTFEHTLLTEKVDALTLETADAEARDVAREVITAEKIAAIEKRIDELTVAAGPAKP